jgi:hypothetical protein
MVEYVGKRLLLLGLFIYIRCYTFHGTVKGFGSRCLNHTAHFFVMLSYYVSLHSEFHVMMSVTILHKNDESVSPAVFMGVRVLFTLVVFVYI